MSNCSKEFSRNNLTFNYEHPEDFYKTRFTRSTPSPYFVYLRWLIAAYNVAWVFVCFLSEGGFGSSMHRKAFYFIYLTQWSYFLLTVRNVVWAAVLSSGRKKTLQDSLYPRQSMLRCEKVLWALLSVTNCSGPLVTLLFWALVYTPERVLYISSIETHAMNTFLVMFDLVVCAAPVRILHFYWPVGYLLSYCGFNLLYYLLGGLNHDGSHCIYKVVDWAPDRVGATAVLLAMVMVAALAMHMFVWLFALLMKRCCRYDQSTNTSTTALEEREPMSVEDEQSQPMSIKEERINVGRQPMSVEEKYVVATMPDKTSLQLPSQYVPATKTV